MKNNEFEQVVPGGTASSKYPSHELAEDGYYQEQYYELGKVDVAIRSNVLTYTYNLFHNKSNYNSLNLELVISNENKGEGNYQGSNRNFKFNYEQCIVKDANEDKYYYYDERNNKHVYIPMATFSYDQRVDYYDSSTGSNLFLRLENNEYRLTDGDKIIYLFDNLGKLYSIKRRYNEKDYKTVNITLDNEDKIIFITNEEDEISISNQENEIKVEVNFADEYIIKTENDLVVSLEKKLINNEGKVDIIKYQYEEDKLTLIYKENSTTPSSKVTNPLDSPIIIPDLKPKYMYQFNYDGDDLIKIRYGNVSFSSFGDSYFNKIVLFDVQDDVYQVTVKQNNLEEVTYYLMYERYDESWDLFEDINLLYKVKSQYKMLNQDTKQIEEIHKILRSENNIITGQLENFNKLKPLKDISNEENISKEKTITNIFDGLGENINNNSVVYFYLDYERLDESYKYMYFEVLKGTEKIYDHKEFMPMFLSRNTIGMMVDLKEVALKNNNSLSGLTLKVKTSDSTAFKIKTLKLYKLRKKNIALVNYNKNNSSVPYKITAADTMYQFDYTIEFGVFDEPFSLSTSELISNLKRFHEYKAKNDTSDFPFFYNNYRNAAMINIIDNNAIVHHSNFNKFNTMYIKDLRVLNGECIDNEYVFSEIQFTQTNEGIGYNIVKYKNINDETFLKSTEEYNENGYLIKSTDDKGVITEYTYDEKGNCTSKTIQADGKKIRYNAIYNDNVSSTQDVRLSVEETTYSIAGPMKTKYLLNGCENVTEVTDGKNQKTLYDYDGNSNVIKVKNESSSKYNTLNYDFNKNVIETKTKNNEEFSFYVDRVNEYTVKNNDQEILKITSKKDGSSVDNVATYGNGTKKEITTDLKGNVIFLREGTIYGENITNYISLSDTYPKRLEPTGDITVNYNGMLSINENVNLSNTPQGLTSPLDSQILRGSNSKLYVKRDDYKKETYFYDELNQLKDKIEDVNYDISLMNQDTITISRKDATKYTYDAKGNIKVIQSLIDGYNILKEISKDDEVIDSSPTYLKTSNIMRKSYADDDVISINENSKFDKFGRLIESKITQETTSPLDLTYNYEYQDFNGETNSLIYSIRAYSNDTVISYENITYDLNGNIVGLYSSINGNITYEYDELNQLIKESNNNSNEVINYQYDENGNITLITKNKSGTTTQNTFTYDTTYKNRLIKHDNIEIEYDNYGNIIKDGTKTYAYNNGNQLTVYTDSDYDLTVLYYYDDEGRRINKVVDYAGNTTLVTYYYQEDQLIMEKYETLGENNEVTATKIKYFYYGNNGLIGFKNEEGYFLYLKNEIMI